MVTPAPSTDRGWAWMIVVAHFLIAFINLGISRSLGVFLKPLMELIDVNTTVVSTIITVRMLTAMISVLVAPMLSERFSERKVVMAGGVIACCGFIVVYFADNIYYCMVFAVLSGLSIGFVTVPTFVIIGKYFKKRRALAVSIGSLGGSVGQLVLPPFFAWLMSEFAVRGTFLILGGMCLNTVVAGALQRPIDLSETVTQTPTERVEGKTNRAFEEDTEAMRNNGECDDNAHAIKDDEDVDENSGENDDKICDVELKTKIKPSTLTDEMCIRQTDSQTGTKFVSETEGRHKIQESFCARLRKVISTQLDVKLLAIPPFLAFIIFGGGSFGFTRPVKLFLVPSAKEDGIPDQEASFLLTVGAITDICCRIVLGYVTDLRFIKPYQVLATTGITAGIFTCSFPFADEYWSMMLVSALIGLTSDVRIYLQVPIVADLVGVSRMGLGIGWVQFTSMLSQAALIPLFGYIRDASGSYDLTFYLCGAFIIAMSAGVFSLVFLEKRSRTMTTLIVPPPLPMTTVVTTVRVPPMVMTTTVTTTTASLKQKDDDLIWHT